MIFEHLLAKLAKFKVFEQVLNKFLTKFDEYNNMTAFKLFWKDFDWKKLEEIS